MNKFFTNPAKKLMSTKTVKNTNYPLGSSLFSKLIMGCFVLLLLAAQTTNVKAQECLNSTSNGSATINTSGSTVLIVEVAVAGEYGTVSGAVAGQTLNIDGEGSPHITVRSGSYNGTVVAQGPKPLSFTNTYTGTLYVHWNDDDDACGNTREFGNSEVTCTNCPMGPSLTASQTNVTCNGLDNGTATVSATGGTSPYTYSWSPAGGTASTASGLAAGGYTVTVTDATSASATQPYSITQPAALVVANSSQTTECIGSSNGTATVSVTGGTQPYTYSWSPSGGSASTGTGLSVGNYTVSISDANGCSTSQTFAIVAETTFTYTGNSPDDWLDQGNWSPCYPGTTIPSGSTVIVSPGSNLIIPTGTTITNEGTLINNGTFTISGGTFDNSGTYGGIGAYTGDVFLNPVGGTVNPGQ